jgi:hypothetical protein
LLEIAEPQPLLISEVFAIKWRPFLTIQWRYFGNDVLKKIVVFLNLFDISIHCLTL